MHSHPGTGSVVSILLFSIAVVSPCAASDARTFPSGVERALSDVYPALVRLAVVEAVPVEGREKKTEVRGSGVIITPDGHVVTNHHVAGRARRITCTLADREEVEAELVGTDPLGDIAVVKLKPQTMRTPVREFPHAKWGDSGRLKAGDRVFAMGSPAALSQSVTEGIVANVEMVWPKEYGGEAALVLEGEPVGAVVRWILHDAPIAGGSSGGPLVDASGRVVGINEIGIGGLGGAIPAVTAQRSAEEIIRHGSVRRAWVGLGVQPLPRSSPRPRGALVADVLPGSPAARAGLEPGDVLVEVGGHAVDVRHAEQMPELNRRIMAAPVGQPLRMTLWRAGAERTLSVSPELRTRAQAQDREVQSWGMTARDITRLEAYELMRDRTDGVLVSSVRPGGPAGQARPAVKTGDVIVKVGTHAVREFADLERASRTLLGPAGTPTSTVVTFERGDEVHLTVVKIGPSETDERSPEVRKAWFPASVQVFTPQLAVAMGQEHVNGVRITRLYPPLKGGPFRVGDVLTHLDGQPIDASESSQVDVFPAMVRRLRVGVPIEVALLRDGRVLKLQSTFAADPLTPREAERHRDGRFEFVARELTVKDRVDRRWPEEQTGVLLDEVTPGGWASLAGLEEDDLLLAVAGERVGDLAGFGRIMARVASLRPDFVVFEVKHRAHTIFAEVRPDWSRTTH